MKYAFPFILLVITPFLAAHPTSSPVEVLKYDLFFSMTSWPEILTCLLPDVVSLANAVFGYGIGTPGGVAGFSGGVKQTSGKAQIVLPSACLHDISLPFANTLFAIILFPSFARQKSSKHAYRHRFQHAPEYDFPCYNL